VRQDGGVRIVSLLPSATEIAFLLGVGDELVGVTHECDWPPEATTIRRVSWSNLPPLAEPAEIDRLVSESVTSGASIYELDRGAIRELAPDLILTQDLCEVCAVPAGHLRAALDVIGCDAEVVSLDPSSLDEVLDCIVIVGKATGTEPTADRLVHELQRRLERVREAVSGRPRARTLALEWGDPPYNGGHWVPEMIEVAGGEAVLASRGVPSTRLAWPDIAESRPETVVFMPCGYDLDAACAEAPRVAARAELRHATRFAAANASAYFSRPGPRLVDGVEALASLLHPGLVTPRVTDAVTIVSSSP
jgi:iron complex transport system substrate-binding protein